MFYHYLTQSYQKATDVIVTFITFTKLLNMLWLPLTDYWVPNLLPCFNKWIFNGNADIQCRCNSNVYCYIGYYIL